MGRGEVLARAARCQGRSLVPGLVLGVPVYTLVQREE